MPFVLNFEIEILTDNSLQEISLIIGMSTAFPIASRVFFGSSPYVLYNLVKILQFYLLTDLSLFTLSMSITSSLMIEMHKLKTKGSRNSNPTSVLFKLSRKNMSKIYSMIQL